MRLVPWKRTDDLDVFFSPVVDFRTELDKVFDRLFTGSLRNIDENGFSPNIELSEEEKHYTVKAELPGMDKDDVTITFDDSVLTIKGEKKEEKVEKKDNAYYSETRYGSFCRRIPIRADINEEGVKAKFKNGLLTLLIPKKEVKESKPISIYVE